MPVDARTAETLIEMAKKAMKMAWAPYSNCKVGAALLTADGSIYTGCNIENSSFSPTVCAERVAIFKAVSEGIHYFTAIAIVGGHHGKITGTFPPCGVCRQVMTEFCDPNSFTVILASSDGYETYLLGELFPYSFSKNNISEKSI